MCIVIIWVLLSCFLRGFISGGAAQGEEGKLIPVSWLDVSGLLSLFL